MWSRLAGYWRAERDRLAVGWVGYLLVGTVLGTPRPEGQAGVALGAILVVALIAYFAAGTTSIRQPRWIFHMRLWSSLTAIVVHVGADLERLSTSPVRWVLLAASLFMVPLAARSVHRPFAFARAPDAQARP